MAQKTVANLNDSVSGLLQGLNLNNVHNLFGAYERTARNLAQNISIPTARGRSNMTIYDGVLDYICPTDIYGSNIIDFAPQGVVRHSNDFVYKKNTMDFDRLKGYLWNGTEVAFDSLNGVDIIRIVSTYPSPKIEIDPMTATTGWTAAGSASGLTLDENIFYQESASLRFNLTGASAGTLTKSTSSVDFTKYVGSGVGFLAIRTPSATDLTSITLRLGSDSTNYYEVIATTAFLGAFSTGDWILVPFDFATATTTGTPVVTLIDYTQIIVTHSASMTSFYVGDLWVSLPSPATLIYETASIFKNATTSAISGSINTSADTIILSDAAYAIYEQECAKAVTKQQGGRLASQGAIQNINEELYGERGNPNKPGLYALYRSDNPTQKLAQVGNWYDE